MSTTPKLYPILLAAGPFPHPGLAKPLTLLGGSSAIETAIKNCEGLAKPLVVLGYRAAVLIRQVPRDAKIVVNENWRAGQLGSLLAGLQHVPLDAAFLLYPVDHVFLTPGVIRRLVQAYQERKRGQELFRPRFKERAGHPVIFSANMRFELERAPTARDVVYRDWSRICFVNVRTPAIWRKMESPARTRRHKRDTRRSNS